MRGAAEKRPVCLTIGGSDSCGGAGIQADLRVFDRFGVQGCSAITALTAQHPAAIIRIEPAPLAQLDAELHAVFDYYDVAVVKTGMLFDADRMALISALLAEHHAGRPLIIDPVMVASSGRSLLAPAAVDTLIHALLPLATLITPNLDEWAVLQAQFSDASTQAHEPAAVAAQLGCAVLLKGGHAADAMLCDRLYLPSGAVHEFQHARAAWTQAAAHGTGCRLAAAIAAGVAHGKTVETAVDAAIEFLITDCKSI